MIGNITCNDRCINEPGHYRCDCSPGYTLQSDMTSCKGMYTNYILHTGLQRVQLAQQDLANNNSESTISYPKQFVGIGHYTKINFSTLAGVYLQLLKPVDILCDILHVRLWFVNTRLASRYVWRLFLATNW